MIDKLNILFLDTSSEILSAALFQQGRIMDINLSRQAGRDVTAVIKEFLNLCRIKLNQIDYICLGLGPGSFTGMRIGCAVAKGLALGADKPVISMSSFFSIAYQSVFEGRDIVVIQDARRGLVYFGHYAWDKKYLLKQKKIGLGQLENFLADLSRISGQSLIFTGESFKFGTIIKKILPKADVVPASVYPLAKYMLKEAQRKIKNKQITLLDKLEPLYLYKSDCQVRRRRDV